MFCDNCGSPLKEGQAYCPQCGYSVAYGDVVPPQSQPQAPYATSPMHPYPQQQPYEPPRRQNDAMVPVLVGVCAVLAMMLVGLGLVAGGVVTLGGDEAASKAAASAAAKTEPTEQKSSAPSEAQPINITVNVPESKQTTTTTTTAAPAPAPTPAPAPAASSSGYMLPDSASRYYSYDELNSLSTWDLYIARNEVYARRGRRFRRDDLQAHFNSCSWYNGRYDPDYFDANIEPTFNACERANVDTMRSIEEGRGSPYL